MYPITTSFALLKSTFMKSNANWKSFGVLEGSFTSTLKPEKIGLARVVSEYTRITSLLMIKLFFNRHSKQCLSLIQIACLDKILSCILILFEPFLFSMLHLLISCSNRTIKVSIVQSVKVHDAAVCVD